MKNVILNNGMGTESAAILLRVLTSATARASLGIAEDFSNLTVVTAMTGNEWPDTKRLNEAHILPLFRKHGIRFVQLARTAPGSDRCWTLLDDSRKPERLHIDGAYTLSDELTSAGTIVIQSGTRKCSIKFKGEVIDAWIHREFGPEAFDQIIGFNAEETRRVVKDEKITSDPKHEFFGRRTGCFPLVDWKWGRRKCEDFVEGLVGEPWAKSACFFCPFAKDHLMPRFQEFPSLAVDALVLEHRALTLNPRMRIFNTMSLRQKIAEAGMLAEIKEADDKIAAMKHSLVRVRRVFRSMSLATRKVEKVAFGTREEMEEALAGKGVVERDEHGITRVTVRELDKTVFPAVEETFVVAPADFTDKEGRGFSKTWDEATRAVPRRKAC